MRVSRRKKVFAQLPRGEKPLKRKKEIAVSLTWAYKGTGTKKKGLPAYGLKQHARGEIRRGHKPPKEGTQPDPCG